MFAVQQKILDRLEKIISQSDGMTLDLSLLPKMNPTTTQRAIARITQLPLLTTLELDNKPIGNSGAVAIAEAAKAGKLKNLSTLSLWNNQIGDAGVRAILAVAATGKLPRLAELYLGCNQIGDLGVREIAKAAWTEKLPHLTTIDLRTNQIGDLGTRAIADAAVAGKLPQLATLNLSDNEIREPGACMIAEAVRSRMLPLLNVLDLIGNHLKVDLSVLASRDPYQIAEAILKGEVLPYARVMFLGMGAVGKTSLFRRCFLDEVVEKEVHHSTHDCDMIHPDECIWEPVVAGQTINTCIWDFGGQLVLHGVHEVLLESDERTIYVLVLDAQQAPEATRSDRDGQTGNRFSYWLRSIRHYAGSSVPVLVAITQTDRFDLNATRPVDEEIEIPRQHSRVRIAGCTDEPDILKESYEVAVNGIVDGCTSKSKSVVSIEPLRDAIEKQMEQLEVFRIGKKVQPEIPELKVLIDARLRDRTHVPLVEYRQWCVELNSRHPRHDNRLLERDYQDGLLRTLHHLGSVMYFGKTAIERERSNSYCPAGLQLHGDPEEYPSLQDDIFNPQWLKFCVYKVVRSGDAWIGPKKLEQISRAGVELFQIELQKRGGTLAVTAPALPIRAVTDLLRYLQLCWYDRQKKEYLFPRGLHEREPDGSQEWKKTSLKWDFFPEANFSRFVVAMHLLNWVPQSGGDYLHSSQWVMVHPTWGHSRAVVVAFPLESRVEVRFDPEGIREEWPRLFEDIRHQLADCIQRRPLVEEPVVPWKISEPANHPDNKQCSVHFKNVGISDSIAARKQVPERRSKPTSVELERIDEARYARVKTAFETAQLAGDPTKLRNLFEITRAAIPEDTIQRQDYRVWYFFTHIVGYVPSPEESGGIQASTVPALHDYLCTESGQYWFKMFGAKSEVIPSDGSFQKSISNARKKLAENQLQILEPRAPKRS